MARKPPLSEDEAIQAYKKRIQSLPPANQYLLLYVLDLLSVFARKADKNLMTAQSKPFRSSIALTQPLTSRPRTFLTTQTSQRYSGQES